MRPVAHRRPGHARRFFRQRSEADVETPEPGRTTSVFCAIRRVQGAVRVSSFCPAASHVCAAVTGQPWTFSKNVAASVTACVNARPFAHARGYHRFSAITRFKVLLVARVPQMTTHSLAFAQPSTRPTNSSRRSMCGLCPASAMTSIRAAGKDRLIPA